METKEISIGEGNDYMSVTARFLFFNGKYRFTVEYAYGISSWFVFNDEESNNCLYSEYDDCIKIKNVNRNAAEEILYKYFSQSKQTSI